jgi:hypothetical protein
MTHNTVESIREEPNDDFLRKLGVALDECTGVANSGFDPQFYSPELLSQTLDTLTKRTYQA